MSVPADLRVLCRKLAATAPADLPAQCPVLVSHVLRCGTSLSVPSEQHAKSNASEAAVLVHKLKTQVQALLNGRTPQARLAGVILAKAVVDVGGWACLRTSEPWVRAMLSLLQRPDPPAAKELCLAVLARLYTLLHASPTLIREIATPTLPVFASACLQLLRQPVLPAKATRTVPPSLAEAVTRAFAALVALYPTTLRPFTTQTRNALRRYLVPTTSDHDGTAEPVPPSLQQGARVLLATLHHTASKNGHANTWARLLGGLVYDAHATADQIFRAVRETHDPRWVAFVLNQPVSYEGVPASGSGGGANDQDRSDADTLVFPSWTGLSSGAERLQGLLATLTAILACPTRTAVTVPLGPLYGLVARLSMVLPPAPAHAGDASLWHPSIGRDERDELWSVLPNIHVAALTLLTQLVGRLDRHAVPLAPEMLADSVRIFVAHRTDPGVRAATYALLNNLLPLLGPSLTRGSVDALGVIVHACCEDLLLASGHVGPQSQQPQQLPPQQQQQQSRHTTGNGVLGVRKPAAPANADLFLPPGTTGASATVVVPAMSLSPAHVRVAEALLATLLLHVPQQHVRKADRALLDRTAVLTANKAALVASVLQPYVDGSGRYFANTVPFLARAFPHDVALEVLRSNLRTVPHHVGALFGAPAADTEGDNDQEVDRATTSLADVAMVDVASVFGNGTFAAEPGAGGFTLPTALAPVTVPETETSALPAPAPLQPLTLKRRADKTESASKRPALSHDLEVAVSVELPEKAPTKREEALVEARAAVLVEAGTDGATSDDDSDGSVQLEMAFDGEDEQD